MATNQICENCYKRKATQADLILNEWLCDDCYSRLDTPNRTDDEIATIERGQFLKAMAKRVKGAK